MDSRLQELWDFHEIRQLLVTYVHGCDRSDLVEMSSIYAEDSWDDHGNTKADGKTYAKLSIEEGAATTNVVSHQLGQAMITVNGDTAGSETYFIATILYPTKDGGESLNQLGGRFVDTLARENGQWKVKKRIVVREWSYTQPISEDWLADGGFTPARRGQTDVSYETLGKRHSGIPEYPVALPA
jgi:hypothetical protein